MLVSQMTLGQLGLDCKCVVLSAAVCPCNARPFRIGITPLLAANTHSTVCTPRSVQCSPVFSLLLAM